MVVYCIYEPQSYWLTCPTTPTGNWIVSRQACKAEWVVYTLDSSALAQALVAGELPTNMLPHVATLLDEAPLPLIVSAIEEIADDYKLAPKSLWKNMTKWAEQLKSNRGVWF